jgi:hypothetical protein
MAGSRFVVLGLAPARSPWFKDVAQWANGSSIPVEFVKCLSAVEVRARLGSSRTFSALLIDSSAPALDRDLVETAQQVSCAVIVIGDRPGGRDWPALGANTVLPAALDRKQLLEALSSHSAMVGRADRLAGDVTHDGAVPGAWQAPLAVVCGPGGTGASTVAIALAQGLAGDVRARGSVLLADLALHADQAMLHDASDIVPGIQELVELCRSGHPTVNQVRVLTYAVTDRGYALLLGLRRSRAWATIRPRAFAAALEALRRSYRVVVADVDPEVEGEDEGGSIDVEERHGMARSTLAVASAVFVVGVPDMKGMHSLVRVTSELLTFGVPADRVVPVLNRAPRASRVRAQLSHAFASLLPDQATSTSPVFLPERRVNEALRDGVRLPDGLCAPLARVFDEVCQLARDSTGHRAEPEPVVPGSLGRWDDGPATLTR